MSEAEPGGLPAVGALDRERRGSRSRRLTIAPVRAGVPTRRDAIFRRLLALADLAAVMAGLAIVSASRHRGIPLVGLWLLPLTVLAAKLTGSYDHDEVVLRKSTLDEIPKLLILAAVGAVGWGLVAENSSVSTNHRGIGIMWAGTALSLVLARGTARAIARRFAPPERVLIVGDTDARAQLAYRLEADPAARTEVVGFVHVEDERGGPGVHELGSLITRLRVQRVFVIPVGADNEITFEALARANAAGVKVSILPGVLDVVGSAVEFDEVGGLTVLSARRPGLSRSSRAVKRAMDIIGALTGLTLFAPFAGVIALAIVLDSRGGVFFRQRRIGRDGRAFEMVKFRTMIQGAELGRPALQERNETEGVFKLSVDPRVTRVGRWLRRTSVDEVPQLLNVLRGEMSLVGPRPLILDEDRLVEGRHRTRLQLAPGMTGPWQVLGPKRPPLSEMVKIDFLYAANWSLWSDVKILVRTLFHVVGLRGV